MIARRTRIVASVLALALLRTTPARADDVSDLEALLSENVVSGASREAEASRDAPATTTTITADDIRRYGIRSLDEAIDFLGMGLVTQNPLHSVEVGGRGVLISADYGNHVLLVVDGHVWNEPWNGTAYFEQGAAIPIELVDHIELVLGPGSVLYGGNAMLGVVNVVTKRAASMRGVHVVAEGSVSPEQGRGGSFTSFSPGDLGGSQRIGVGGGHTFSLLGKPLGWTGQVELYRQRGPSFAWGPQRVAPNEDGSFTSFGPGRERGVWEGRTHESYATSVPALYTRLEWNGFSVAFRAAEYERKTPYINGFNQGIADFDDPRNRERDSWFSLDLSHRARIGRLSTLARVYGDSYTYDQFLYEADGSACTFPVAGTCLSHGNGRARWGGTELQGSYDWLGDGRLTTMLGFDGRLRRVASYSQYVDDDTGQEAGALGDRKVTDFAWAAYAQQRYRPFRPLVLNGGARLDHDPRGGRRLSPRAAAVLTPWRNGTLKAIYSEAFRAPSFYEKYYEDSYVTPAASLSSEVVRSAETSLEQRSGRHRVLFGVYRTWWSGLISQEMVGPETYASANTSTIDNWGYNARVTGGVGDVDYGLSVTGAYARERTDEGPALLPVSPQLFGNARVAWDMPGALPTIALATTLVGRRPADRALDGGFDVPPYAPAQARMRLTLSDRVPGVQGLSYRLSAEYVTKGGSAYVAGPVQYAETAATPGVAAELAPVNRATLFLTLKYELGLP